MVQYLQEDFATSLRVSGPELDYQADLDDLEGMYQYLTEGSLEVRRRLVKDKLDLNMEYDRELVARLYQRWVLDDIHIVVEKLDTAMDVTTWECHKARKRGNDVDAFRIRQRLKHLAANVEEYARDPDAAAGKAPSHTRAVYLTLTYDPAKVGGDVNLAWGKVGEDYNRFISALKKKFGTVTAEVVDDQFVSREVPQAIYHVRSWEAHASGMPHIHAILCFDSWSWRIFKDSKLRWRLDKKALLEDAWPHGFIDAQGLTLGTLERRLEDVVWYVGKHQSDNDYRLVAQWPLKRKLTLATLWYLGKRSFSVSKELAGQRDLTKRVSIIQTTLEGEVVESPRFVWKFLGLCRRVHSELARDDWIVSLKHPPDWLDYCWKPKYRERSCGYAASWFR